MSKALKGITPLSWAVGAREFLEAVNQLSIEGAENDLQVKQTSPSLVLLGYAYEQLFKANHLHWNGEFQKTHDLITLWDGIGVDIKNKISDWTDEYVDINRNAISSVYSDAVLEIEPTFGEPNEDFEVNIERLNRWTSEPNFLARYRKIGIMADAVVDIRLLHFMGEKIAQFSCETYRND